jgi:hydrogenase-4 membrane subunit HyfE
MVTGRDRVTLSRPVTPGILATPCSELAQEGPAKRLSDKTMLQIGIILIVAGVVLGMGVSSIPAIALGLKVGLLVFALVLFAAGLLLITKYRAKDT